MGWFGEGIADGDTPMDFESLFSEALGLDSLDAHSMTGSVMLRVQERWDWVKMMKVARKWEDQEAVGHQVLATWAMAAGVPMNDAIKARLRAEIERDDSELFINSERRKAEIARLLRGLDRYDGTPLLWESLPLELTDKQQEIRLGFGTDLLNNIWAIDYLKVTAQDVAEALEEMPDEKIAELDRQLGGLFSDIASIMKEREQRQEDDRENA